MYTCWHCGSNTDRGGALGSWVRRSGEKVTQGHVCQKCDNSAGYYTGPNGICPACNQRFDVKPFDDAVRIVARRKDGEIYADILCLTCMRKDGMAV